MSLSEPIFQFKENLLQHFNCRRLVSRRRKIRKNRQAEGYQKSLILQFGIQIVSTHWYGKAKLECVFCEFQSQYYCCIFSVNCLLSLLWRKKSSSTFSMDFFLFVWVWRLDDIKVFQTKYETDMYCIRIAKYSGICPKFFQCIHSSKILPNFD